MVGPAPPTSMGASGTFHSSRRLLKTVGLLDRFDLIQQLVFRHAFGVGLHQAVVGICNIAQLRQRHGGQLGHQ